MFNGGERGAAQGRRHGAPTLRTKPRRAVYSALPDLHTAQTSAQALQAKVTPRLLLAARAQSMCHAMES